MELVNLFFISLADSIVSSNSMCQMFHAVLRSSIALSSMCRVVHGVDTVTCAWCSRVRVNIRILSCLLCSSHISFTACFFCSYPVEESPHSLLPLVDCCSLFINEYWFVLLLIPQSLILCVAAYNFGQEFCRLHVTLKSFLTASTAPLIEVHMTSGLLLLWTH